MSPSTSKQDVVWASENDDIATVDSNGKVQAVSKGETWVTVHSKEDEEIEDMCSVKVEDPEPEINKEKLQNLINQAKEYSNSDGKYTEESFNSLQNAISSAEDKLSGATSQGELDEAENALQKAVDSLEEYQPEITTEEVTEEIDVVEYETTRNETDELPKGEEKVVQEGKNGYTKVTYKVTYEDGKEVDREEVDRETVDPVNEVINVGTFEEPEVTVETETENIDIVKFETVRNETDDLPKGEEKTVQEGKDGYTKVTYEVTYEDGKEVKREEKNRETIDPVDEIINVGTFEEPEPEPEPDPEPEEPEGD